MEDFVFEEVHVVNFFGSLKKSVVNLHNYNQNWGKNLKHDGYCLEFQFKRQATEILVSQVHFI